MACFALWSLGAAQLAASSLAPIVSVILDGLFRGLATHSTYDTTSDILQLQAPLFTASQPYPHYSYRPDLQISQVAAFSIGNFSLYTLGLPLLWFFTAVLKSQRWQSVLLSHLWLMLMIIGATVLKMSYKVILHLQTPQLHRVLIEEGYILTPALPPEWLAAVLKPVVDSMDITAVAVAPIALAYYFSGRGLMPLRNQPKDSSQQA